MARPRLHDDELRQRLVRRAAEVVTESGVKQLSLRTLASAEGTSTSAIYSLFGGKGELLGAIFDTARDSFGAAQHASPMTEDPLVDLVSLAHAYRKWAVGNPHLFHVMFGDVLGDYTLTDEQRSRSHATMGPLVETVQRCVSRGLFIGPTDHIVMTCWSAVQGFVSLELAPAGRQFDGQSDALFEGVVRGTIRGWTREGVSVP